MAFYKIGYWEEVEICGGALPQSPLSATDEINLPRHDLLGEERWPGRSLKGEGPRAFPPWAFIRFILHRNTGKAHQSLSGSKGQRIDNIKSFEGLF